jgi:hypothetical protein
LRIFSKSSLSALCILLFSTMPADAWYVSTQTPSALVGKPVLPAVPGLNAADCEKKLEVGGKWRDLGYGIRYIEYRAGYCHYYDGKDLSKANRSGPDTYRYDPHNGLLFTCRYKMKNKTLEEDLLLIQRCLESHREIAWTSPTSKAGQDYILKYNK